MSKPYYRAGKGWRYDFWYRGVRYTKDGFDSAGKAGKAQEAKRVELGVQEHLGAPSPSNRMTLREYVSLWMGDHVKVNLRPRTARAYRQALDLHALPLLGNYGLTTLTRAQMRSHFNVLAASGLSRGTVKNVLIPLRACLNAAVDDGLIEQNPVTGLMRRVRARTVKDAARVQCYTPAQLATILDAAKGDFGDFVRLLAGSGLRLGEALGVQPADVGEGCLHVRRTVQWLDGECDTLAPKSGQERRVDVTHDLAARLRARPGPWLFGGAAPWRPETPRKAWYALLDGLDVPRLRLHDLRHTYAALLLGQGAPSGYVKEQMGHSSITVTHDVYGHLIPGSNRKWVDQTF